MMAKKRLVFIIIAIWFTIVVCWVARSEYALNGQEVLLRTVPVDPRDLVMGDYVILNYEIGQFAPKDYIQYEANRVVYVALEIDKNNIATTKRIFFEKPKDTLFIKGKMKECDTVVPLLKSGKCIKYGIESYYVKEKEGRKLEENLSAGALVRVSIDEFGEAKVKGFVLK